MFANAGPKGLPIATPSNCLFIWLLKLNSTPRVAISINSLNVSSGNGGQSRGPRYKALAQISMISSNGTFVNRLLMSKEHRNDLAGSRLQFWIKLANVKESFTQCEEYKFRTCTKLSANHLSLAHTARFFWLRTDIFVAGDENLLCAGNTYKRFVADDDLQYQIC